MEFVWYFYFWLHVSVKWSFLPFSSPSLSLFCFFPIVFLDPRYIGMTGQSAVCARFVALSFLLSFSYPLLLHLLVCDWFILIYFLLIFWLWVNLKFFFSFCFFWFCLFVVGGGCVSLQVHGMHIHNVLKVSSLSPYPWMHDCQCAVSKRNLKNKKYQPRLH